MPSQHACCSLAGEASSRCKTSISVVRHTMQASQLPEKAANSRHAHDLYTFYLHRLGTLVKRLGY